MLSLLDDERIQVIIYQPGSNFTPPIHDCTCRPEVLIELPIPFFLLYYLWFNAILTQFPDITRPDNFRSTLVPDDSHQNGFK